MMKELSWQGEEKRWKARKMRRKERAGRARR